MMKKGVFVITALALAATMAAGAFLLTGKESHAATKNTWMKTDNDGVANTIGVSFGAPDGAEDIVYYVNTDTETATMNFRTGDVYYTARAEHTHGPEDISGMPEGLGCGREVLVGGIYEGAAYELDDNGHTFLRMFYDADHELSYAVYAMGTEANDENLAVVASTVSTSHRSGEELHSYISDAGYFGMC